VGDAEAVGAEVFVSGPWVGVIVRLRRSWCRDTRKVPGISG
jgi:hypothetical protein